MARLGPRDCTSGKHCYEAEKYAKRALRVLKSKGVAKTGFPYQCDECKGWHISSSRALRRRA